MTRKEAACLALDRGLIARMEKCDDNMWIAFGLDGDGHADDTWVDAILTTIEAHRAEHAGCEPLDYPTGYPGENAP